MYTTIILSDGVGSTCHEDGLCAVAGLTTVAAKDIQLRTDGGRGVLIAGRRPFRAFHIGCRPDAYGRCLQGRASKVGPICNILSTILRQRAQLLLVCLGERPPVWLQK